MSLKITILGGGPAGLYLALLLRQWCPRSRVEIFERNREGDTFGFGVVFSDETLANFLDADPVTAAAIRASFVHWSEIHTHVGGAKTVSTGHGFSGMGRKRLLQILQKRARELGVEIHFQTDVASLRSLEPADVIVVADGVNSRFREELASKLSPSVDWRLSRFSWLGTDYPLSAFTFLFQPSPHGLFVVHAYPYEDGLSTWIVECNEETWKRAGLDHADDDATVAILGPVFRDFLGSHRLIPNRSIWRRFPTIRCEKWSAGNVVLLGDAVHTAHFSIGSGTKLAMEGAISLARALSEEPTSEVAFARYERERKIETLKLQRAAQTSLEWFEHPDRYLKQGPQQFSFNLMTRSKRITYDNLRQRDPALVLAANREVLPQTADFPPAFSPFQLRDLRLPNRVVVSPMCQYSAEAGVPGDWHLVHLGSRAVGGAGLVIAEMTNVSSEGRITLGCTGLWNDTQAQAWERIVQFVHRSSQAKIGIQIAHAGRKGSALRPWDGPDGPLPPSERWTTLAPSPLPFSAGWPTPREMDESDLERTRQQFVASTRLADRCGFDLVELHMAHGYLLSSFLSPLSNRRTDQWGGSLEARLRYPLSVLSAVRTAWPAKKPISVRISATDWVKEGGMTSDDSVLVARALKDHGCDIVDVSTGGVSPDGRPEYGRMYQVPFAERIRHEVGIPVMAVGAIQSIDHVNTVILAGRADLCAIARSHLYDPYLTLHAAADAGISADFWPAQYRAGSARPRSD